MRLVKDISVSPSETNWVGVPTHNCYWRACPVAIDGALLRPVKTGATPQEAEQAAQVALTEIYAGIREDETRAARVRRRIEDRLRKAELALYLGVSTD